MPEMPEVQTVVDQLNRLSLIGQKITAATVHWPKTVAEPDPEGFCRTIVGCEILKIDRRGKYIVCRLSDRWTLLIHLRMSGRLKWISTECRRNPHEHVILEIGGSHQLRFQDTRKFGRFFLTRRPQRILDRLGPEPMGRQFTRRRLHAMLKAARRQIKPLLLDQHFLAGLGNIYVDESLWHAGIHPLRKSDSLTDGEIGRLHRAIRHALRKGLRNQGTSLGHGKGNFLTVDHQPGRNADQLDVFHRTGEPCSRCGTRIARIIVGQRSSHICPQCQPAAG